MKNKFSIFYIQFSKIKFQIYSGFTLIELIVTVALFSIIASVGTEVLVLTLRNSSKSEITKEVRQNGDYMMQVIQNMIRNARDVEGLCNISSTSVTLTNADGYQTVFRCENGKIASNSAYPPATPTVAYNLSSDSVTLTSCNFTLICPTPALLGKYVYITYTAEQSGGAGVPVENKVRLDYQSTIRQRTYTQ